MHAVSRRCKTRSSFCEPTSATRKRPSARHQGQSWRTCVNETFSAYDLLKNEKPAVLSFTTQAIKVFRMDYHPERRCFDSPFRSAGIHNVVAKLVDRSIHRDRTDDAFELIGRKHWHHQLASIIRSLHDPRFFSNLLYFASLSDATSKLRILLNGLVARLASGRACGPGRRGWMRSRGAAASAR